MCRIITKFKGSNCLELFVLLYKTAPLHYASHYKVTSVSKSKHGHISIIFTQLWLSCLYNLLGPTYIYH